MATRKRSKARPKPMLLNAEDVLNRAFEYNELERQFLLVSKEYNSLRDKVASLLNKDQVEAARVCGVAPEIYCLEWIDIILKRDLKKYTPSFGEHVSNFRDTQGVPI